MLGPYDRLQAKDLRLPNPSPAIGAYVPFVRSGALIYVSGQVSKDDDRSVVGKVGQEVLRTDALVAGEICALNILSQLHEATGGQLKKISRITSLTCYVNTGSKPTPLSSAVSNHCVGLLYDILSSPPAESIKVVEVENLPLGFSVEVDGVFELGEEQ